MDEQQMFQNMVAIVSVATEGLTDLELAVLNIVAQTDGDPHGRAFDYEEVKYFFAENGKMHEETKNALAAVVNRRLGDTR